MMRSLDLRLNARLTT